MIDELITVLKEDGNDTDGVMKRFMGRKDFYEKYLRKFLEDPCFGNLTEALKAGDVQEAFTASHTLKGISANLGLIKLYEVDVVIVEKLRAGIIEGTQEDYEAIKVEYLRAIDLISKYID